MNNICDRHYLLHNNENERTIISSKKTIFLTKNIYSDTYGNLENGVPPPPAYNPNFKALRDLLKVLNLHEICSI